MIRLILFLFLFSMGLTTLPCSLAIEPHCQESQIHTFRLVEMDQSQDPFLDYCELARSRVPSPLLEMMKRIGTAHSRLAAFLETPAEQLFPEGVSIRITGDEKGSQAYEADGVTNIVGITVFPDWQGPGFDETSYIHELGHLLMTPASQNHSLIEDFDSHSLFSEGFADSLALAVDQKISRVDPLLSSCLNYHFNRHPNESTTFNSSTWFFSTRYPYDQAAQCCLHDAETQKSPYSKRLCDSLMSDMDKFGFQISGAPKEQNPFDPKRCFTENKEVNFLQCNPHSLGIPINAFLLALEKARPTKKMPNIFRLFLNAVRTASTQPRVPYACHYNSLEGTKTRIRLEAYSYRQIFKLLKDSLGNQMGKTFDRLWNHYALEKGMEFNDLEETGVLLPEKAHQEVKMKTTPQNNPCWSVSYKSARTNGFPECEIICQKE